MSSAPLPVDRSEGRGDASTVLHWLVLAALAAWFSVPTLASLNDQWLGSAYTHGYLIVVLTIWLVVREIRRAPLEPWAPSALGLACLLGAIVGVVAGHAGSAELVAKVLLPVVWITAVWGVTGPTNARRLAPAIAYLYFAIPWWDVLNPLLQGGTVRMVAAWVRTARIPAYIEGNFISIPSGSFEVAGGCSGLQYMIVGMALATLWALLYERRWSRRLLLVGTAFCLTLLANWVRVFVIIVAGYLTDMQHYLIVKDHYYFGWALFFVFLSPLWLLDRWLQRSARSNETAREVAPPIRARAALTVSYVALAALGLGALLVHRSVAVEEAPAAAAVRLTNFADWQRLEEWSGNSRPVFSGASVVSSAWYESASRSVGAYVAGYSIQMQGKEVTFYANRPEGEAARITSRQPVSVAGQLDVMPFVELEVADSGGGRRLVWYQTRIAGTPATTDIVAKGLQVLGALRGRRDAAAIVFTARCSMDCDGARQAISAFARAAAEPLAACIERATASMSPDKPEVCDG